MTVGLQIFNAHGELLLDATSRVGRIKGSQYINGNAGSVAMDLSDGEPFWSFQPDFLFMHINGNSPVPIVSISAGGVSWSYSPPPTQSYLYPIKGWLFWGCY